MTFPEDLEDKARDASRANREMYDRLESLGESLDREEEVIDRLEEEIERPYELVYDLLDQMESDYRRVDAFADQIGDRQEQYNNRLESLYSGFETEDFSMDDLFDPDPWSGDVWQENSRGQNPWVNTWGMQQWDRWMNQWMNSWGFQQDWSYGGEWRSGEQEVRDETGQNLKENDFSSNTGYGWNSWSNGIQFQAPGFQYQSFWF